MSSNSTQNNLLSQLLIENGSLIVIACALTIFAVIFLIIFKSPITEALNRIKNFSYDNENGLRIDTTPPEQNEPLDNESSSPPEIDTELLDGDGGDSWLETAHNAFKDGDITSASEAFRKGMLSVADSSEEYRNKAFFLFLQYEVAGDISAIDLLEDHVRKANSEEETLYTLNWLSAALVDERRFEQAIELWKPANTGFIENDNLVEASISLADVYTKSGCHEQAKTTLIDTIQLTSKNSHLSKIYKTLSEVENEMGNINLSVYCLDKAVEYEPAARTELFNSAYNASNNNLKEIAVANYETLVKRDSRHAIALNNLGVAAKDAGCKIESVKKYKLSSDLNETLAMANQGYALLNAGFVEEAEELANTALKQESVHPNVHKLIAEIEKRKKDERQKWEELVEASYRKQAKFRKYIEQYYLGDSRSVLGHWLAEEQFEVEISSSTNIDITWETNNAKNKIVGTINGTTIEGRYTKNYKHEAGLSFFNSSDINTNCLGIMEQNSIEIFSMNSDTLVDIKLTRKV